MQARDFRSIGRAAQEELRRRALFLIEQQGLSQGKAAQLVGHGIEAELAGIRVMRRKAI